MATMTGGVAAARALRAEGIDTVFGIVGTHNFQIFDGLFQTEGMRVVTARHEQGAGFMADGYARATGRIAACVVVPGPGLTNIMTAMGQSYSDSVPFITLTGQNPVDRLDRELEDFHELRRSIEVASTVTSSARRVARGADIPGAVRDAVRLMRASRPRPTFIEIPMDVLGGTHDVPELAPIEDYPRPGGSDVAIGAAAGVLRGVRRPLILAGGGVIAAGGSAALRRLAERLGAPVITTCHGKGAIPDDDPYAIGDGWGRLTFFDELLKRADSCVAIGTRFSVVNDFWQGAKLPDPLIHIDLDPKVINQLRASTVGIVGDARNVMERLLAELGDGSPPAPWCDVEAERATRRREVRRAAGPVVDILDSIRANVPRDAIVADDLCLPGYWGGPALDVYEPRTYFHPGMYGTLGYGLPAAVGAAIGRPDRVVVAMAGDGGFMYTSQELATAVQQRARVIAIVFNDNAYGALKLWQDRFTDGRQVGVRLHNPDFAKLGEAYGAMGIRLDSYRQLGPAVARAVEHGGPVVIECPLDFDLDKYLPPWMPGVGER
jgi:thiamine pyrophosphate-dependent acetolactate synthase large subunit-like protein